MQLFRQHPGQRGFTHPDGTLDCDKFWLFKKIGHSVATANSPKAKKNRRYHDPARLETFGPLN
jgi:hypothetical protein